MMENPDINLHKPQWLLSVDVIPACDYAFSQYDIDGMISLRGGKLY